MLRVHTWAYLVMYSQAGCPPKNKKGRWTSKCKSVKISSQLPQCRINNHGNNNNNTQQFNKLIVDRKKKLLCVMTTIYINEVSRWRVKLWSEFYHMLCEVWTPHTHTSTFSACQCVFGTLTCWHRIPPSKMKFNLAAVQQSVIIFQVNHVLP